MRIYEIFDSIDGEVTGFACPHTSTTFIRTAGCNLDCAWCDTPKARDVRNGIEMSVSDILQSELLLRKVTITGGEPLLQHEEVHELTKGLLKLGHRITLETNGSIRIPQELIVLACAPIAVSGQLRFVVDYKLPSSNMHSFMPPDILDELPYKSIVKVVVTSIDDLLDLPFPAGFHLPVVLSPVNGNLELAEQLAKEIVLRRLDLGISVQLHKHLRMR